MVSVKTKEDFKRKLWAGANELRGSMDASRYKDYMLGLMFYKFLSDKTLESFRAISRLSNEVPEQELIEAYAAAHEKHGEKLENSLRNRIGYCIAPNALYQQWVKDIDAGVFELEKVTNDLNSFEQSIATGETASDFKGLFSSSQMDFSNTALGDNLNKRSKNVSKLIMMFADLDMISLQKGDILGEAYEYLIGQFAMESGKKAGEFYTPHQVSEVMAQIVAKNGDIKSIYDPTVGSGSLLLTVGKHLTAEAQKDLEYYGQESNTATYNLTRMNLILHGVKPEKMTINNGDTLMRDWPEDPEHPDKGVLFDAVVMNPPYSQKNWNKEGLTNSDPRFEFVGTLPPESKGDFAFLLHGLYHLSQTGTMAIVLPHGVLFRGGDEGAIRRRLLEKNCIDAIIGLPSNLFTNTGIPVTVIILKKNRDLGAPVLFIDSSKHFIKVGKQNELQEKDIIRIVDTYLSRSEVDGFSHLATLQEIEANDYNLNIPRYVDSSEKVIPHDVDAHLHGGIPVANIESLNVLQDEVPELLEGALSPLREGYVTLNQSMDELLNDTLNSPSVIDKKQRLIAELDTYIHHWWQTLKQVTADHHLMALKEEMFNGIKEILGHYTHVDIYDGVQMIADIWKTSLTKDLEVIMATPEGFYSAARLRQPHMVEKTKDNKKTLVQEGFEGVIIKKKLIEGRYYTEQLNEVQLVQNQVAEVVANLEELLEQATTDEDSVFAEALNDKGDNFTTTSIKEALKNYDAGSEEATQLQNLQKLMKQKTALNKRIKDLNTKLNQEVEDRILELSDDEVDTLMFEKWFGNLADGLTYLVELPIRNDLAILGVLNERYADTLTALDDEIASLEATLNSMMSELVVEP